jgi:hypothetical protein
LEGEEESTERCARGCSPPLHYLLFLILACGGPVVCGLALFALMKVDTSTRASRIEVIASVFALGKRRRRRRKRVAYLLKFPRRGAKTTFPSFRDNPTQRVLNRAIFGDVVVVVDS